MRFRSFVLGSIAPLFVTPEGGDPPPGGGGAPPAGGGAPPAGGGAAFSFPTDKPFAEYLPEKFRADPSFRDIKNFEGLVSSYAGAAKMVGMDKGRVLAVPGDDDAAAWDNFFNSAGRPESADKYTVPKLANGEYSAEAQAFQKQLLPMLHKAGLTQKQLNAIVPAWNEMQAGQAKAAKDAEAAQLQQTTSALKTEFGAAYDERLGLAQKAIQHLTGELKLGDALTKELDATKLGNNPALFKLFAHFGSQLQEDGVLGKGGGGGSGALSPSEAKQQLSALERDAANIEALRDRKHPKHEELQAQRTRLYEMAHPSAG